MIEIVGIKFREEGHIHFFKSAKYNLKKGDYCWAETSRGSSLGKVAMATTKAHPAIIPDNLPKILAVAEEHEATAFDNDHILEQDSFKCCQRLVLGHELEMKLVKCRYVNENKKVIFFFTAESRVDFRNLLKDLTKEFKARIELRQIGVRDEAKILGGLGGCGRTLCCATWIDDFRPVSIKMAKQQNLSLDPQKISGICGRLKCCLSFEAPSTGGGHKPANVSDCKKGVSGCFCPSDPKPFDPPL
jgi:cell fate regulator YaaT (PSP1 superfamily)